MQYELDFSFLPKYYRFFIDGIQYTLVLAILAVVLGTILGTLIAMMKISRVRILRWISSAYIEFIRGTPLLVQIYIIVYGLPMMGLLEFPDIPGFDDFPRLAGGILALSMNSAAYVAEIVRSGIQAVDVGQTEAARSLGLSGGLTMRRIVLPQAVKNILPALGNEFVVVVKESSIVSIIGIGELMYMADTIRGMTFRVFEPLVVVALLYFIITFTLGKIVAAFERRLRRSD